MNRYFTEEDMQISNKYTERCSASLTIEEVQSKTTIRQNSAPIRMAKTENCDDIEQLQGCRESG